MLEKGPNPIVQFAGSSRLLIIGQAPGAKVRMVPALRGAILAYGPPAAMVRGPDRARPRAGVLSLDVRTRLAREHMLDAITDLRTLLAGYGRAEFVADRLCQRRVERCLEVVSEVSRRLPAHLKAAHPDIEWRKIAGVGNVLRNDYDEIDADVVCQTATVEIQPLAQLVQALLAGLQGRRSTPDRA